MLNVHSNIKLQKGKTKFDLEERMATFSENIINFCQILPKNDITRPLISQLIRSATSIGANYYEANEANSRKDFINKAGISKKEAAETKYWLRLISHTVPDQKAKAMLLWQETQEFTLILAAVIRNSG